ncbi:hypothetical protein MIR68_010430 [Amoeboaphelidium protococcarum]|nr:hypothetical protein MIR68_010430 [Amoeboaphelidium protococcarum]
MQPDANQQRELTVSGVSNKLLKEGLTRLLEVHGIQITNDIFSITQFCKDPKFAYSTNQWRSQAKDIHELARNKFGLKKDFIKDYPYKTTCARIEELYFILQKACRMNMLEKQLLELMGGDPQSVATSSAVVAPPLFQAQTETRVFRFQADSNVADLIGGLNNTKVLAVQIFFEGLPLLLNEPQVQDLLSDTGLTQYQKLVTDSDLNTLKQDLHRLISGRNEQCEDQVYAHVKKTLEIVFVIAGVSQYTQFACKLVVCLLAIFDQPHAIKYCARFLQAFKLEPYLLKALINQVGLITKDCSEHLHKLFGESRTFLTDLILITASNAWWIDPTWTLMRAIELWHAANFSSPGNPQLSLCTLALVWIQQSPGNSVQQINEVFCRRLKQELCNWRSTMCDEQFETLKDLLVVKWKDADEFGLLLSKIVEQEPKIGSRNLLEPPRPQRRCFMCNELANHQCGDIIRCCKHTILAKDATCKPFEEEHICLISCDVLDCNDVAQHWHEVQQNFQCCEHADDQPPMDKNHTCSLNDSTEDSLNSLSSRTSAN